MAKSKEHHTYKGHASEFRRDDGMKPGHNSYPHHQIAQPHNHSFKARDFHQEKGHYTKPEEIHLSKVSHAKHDVDGNRFAMNGGKHNSAINNGTQNAAHTDTWHSQSSTSSSGYEMMTRSKSAYHGSRGYGGGGTEFRGSRGYKE
jgi:hypothetical protein